MLQPHATCASGFRRARGTRDGEQPPRPQRTRAGTRRRSSPCGDAARMPGSAERGTAPDAYSQPHAPHDLGARPTPAPRPPRQRRRTARGHPRPPLNGSIGPAWVTSAHERPRWRFRFRGNSVARPRVSRETPQAASEVAGARTRPDYRAGDPRGVTLGACPGQNDRPPDARLGLEHDQVADASGPCQPTPGSGGVNVRLARSPCGQARRRPASLRGHHNGVSRETSLAPLRAAASKSV